MVASEQARIEYTLALDNLRQLAQRDLIHWWKQADGMSFADARAMMVEPFQAIVQAYGEQAAYAAADYLFLERSLDDELAGLPFPDLADPVSYEQAKSSYYWATDVLREAEDGDLAARMHALRRLGGVTNRLILQPSRDTVAGASLSAGTGYARVVEPGGCAFCMMLAGRGAVYSKNTVGAVNKFHDNCRCIGIEVKSDKDLPQLNKDLAREWEKFDEFMRRDDVDLNLDVNGWASYIRAKKNGDLDRLIKES